MQDTEENQGELSRNARPESLPIGLLEIYEAFLD